MVNIKTIGRGMQVLFYASNVMRLLEREGQNPREGEESREKMAFLGRVFSVNIQENTIALRVRDEIQNFAPDELWLLPDPELTTCTPPEPVHHQLHDSKHQSECSVPPSRDRNLLQLLAGFIKTLAEGGSSPESVKEIAMTLEVKGIARKSTRAQQIIEALR